MIDLHKLIQDLLESCVLGAGHEDAAGDIRRAVIGYRNGLAVTADGRTWKIVVGRSDGE
jgi:hypothetical protein